MRRARWREVSEDVPGSAPAAPRSRRLGGEQQGENPARPAEQRSRSAADPLAVAAGGEASPAGGPADAPTCFTRSTPILVAPVPPFTRR